jgi:sugar lactone lactonase YvrE
LSSKGTLVAEPKIELTGLALGESPRWHEGRLWFANWIAQEVVAGDEVVLRMSSFPFSIDWLPDGRLLVLSGREARLLVDGTALYADLGGLFAPPWNELVVDGRGRAYVNYTGFEFPGGEFAPGGIAVVDGSGPARVVADGLAFPNGMAVTPDGATLIVAESYAGRLTAFDIAPDGGLSGRRVWAAVAGSAPDGVCIDASGAVWYADVPNQRCVRVREGGEILDTVALDRGAFACVLGGEDRRTLYIMAASWEGIGGLDSEARTGQVLSVEAPEPGAGWP